VPAFCLQKICSEVIFRADFVFLQHKKGSLTAEQR